MGNRAVLTAATAGGYNASAQGVYLHWNGGRDSVKAFLKYCEMQGFRSPDIDPSYGWARFIQVVSNYFGGTLSIGIGRTGDLDCDNGDNGLYIVKGWKIAGRRFFDGKEQDAYPLKEMLLDIDAAQPESMQIRDKIVIEFAISEAKQAFLNITGSEENGYQVVLIVMTSTGRRFTTLYKDASYDNCMQFMTAEAQTRGFAYNNAAGMWAKTA